MSDDKETKTIPSSFSWSSWKKESIISTEKLRYDEKNGLPYFVDRVNLVTDSYQTDKSGLVTYNFNNHGWRGSLNYEVDKAHPQIFNVCVGCSLMEGVGLHEEQTASYKIQEHTGIETYNLSLEGTGADYILWILSFLLKFGDPDYIGRTKINTELSDNLDYYDPLDTQRSVPKNKQLNKVYILICYTDRYLKVFEGEKYLQNIQHTKPQGESYKLTLIEQICKYRNWKVLRTNNTHVESFDKSADKLHPNEDFQDEVFNGFIKEGI
jgi:hypothetical protein